MLKRLNELNVPRPILPADSPAMRRYGQIIEGIDCREMFDDALKAAQRDDVTYILDIEALHRHKSLEEIRLAVYGDRPLQAGICFGRNDRMNGMEYHEGSEVIVSVTDSVLILGRAEDISGNCWDSSLAECFYLPPGTVLELFSNTLHLAPCRVDGNPFCTIIILPLGTNRPLDKEKLTGPLHFMENKWLICHSESPAAARGAHVGITGENIRIRT